MFVGCDEKDNHKYASVRRTNTSKKYRRLSYAFNSWNILLPIEKYLENHSEITKLILCLDSDDEGNFFAQKIKEKFGCEIDNVEGIKIEPKRVVYVLCDPATMARDVKIFCDGGYVVEEISRLICFGRLHMWSPVHYL